MTFARGGSPTESAADRKMAGVFKVTGELLLATMKVKLLMATPAKVSHQMPESFPAFNPPTCKVPATLLLALGSKTLLRFQTHTALKPALPTA